MDKKVLLFFTIAFVATILFVLTGNANPQSFDESKELLKKAWSRHGFTQDFYCQAPFQFINEDMVVKPSQYYTPRKLVVGKNKPNIRAKRIELEHIMPAHSFGKHLECWKMGGRKGCRNDKIFNYIEADLYNIVPAIGEINADRSNYRYAESNMIPFGQYGNCPIYIDFKAKRFYPANYSKGLIARTYIYMSKTYNIRLSNSELKLMQTWDKMYPPNEYEIKRNEIINEIMLWQRIHLLQKIF